MSWNWPFGKVRRITNGKKPDSSSVVAITMGSVILLGRSINIGAPIVICKALVLMILDFSYLVSLGGPILISISIEAAPESLMKEKGMEYSVN
jgi:hypothetical protein